MSGVFPPFREKMRVVAAWCRAHAATLKGAERREWQKFAAFLELLAGDPPKI
jgi:hypothetical protein